MIEVTKHKDGDALNEALTVTSDTRDPEAGNGTHLYEFAHEGAGLVGTLQFQHGPRDEPGSKPGVSAASVLGVMIDHFESFQSGPYACRENALVITKLEEALHWVQHRTADRTKRGVIGRNQK